MSEQIKRSDIAEVDVFKHIIEGGKQAEAVISKLNQELKESARINKQELAKNIKFGNAQEIKEVEKQMKLANLQIKEKAKLDAELIKIQAQRVKAETQLKTAQEKQAKATQQQANAYKELVVKTREAKNKSKELGAELLKLEQTVGKNSKEYNILEKKYRNVTNEASRFDKQLKSIDSRVGDNFRNVGNYGSALGKLRSTLLQFTAGFGVVTLFRESFNVVKDFDQGVANLASVLGKTRSEIQLLEQDAKRLGATTKFTASEVAQLQTEFAKLGFSQQEILNATEGTLALAGATGTDLARSAEVAGSTLRGFGLDAQEMQRVVDVMAKSFSSSALDTEKFAESMKYVAPIAKVAGLSIEETTALLGKLADAGISGSQAGTSLRQIISQLDKTGKTTGEALKDLATKGLDLAGAEEEVGKNAKTALLVLADQTKQVDELKLKLDDAEGSAQKMAETQLNTLGGSLALLRSAFEGYILGVNDSTRANSKLRNGIKFLAENFGTVMGIIGKVIKAYLLYRGTMIVMRTAQMLFNAEMRKSIFSFGNLTSSVKNADGSISKFGNALKGVGWTVAIGLAVELGRVVWDFVSGARAARVELEILNKITQDLNKKGQQQSSLVMGNFERELALIEQKLDKLRIEKKSKQEILKVEKQLKEELKKKIETQTTNDRANLFATQLRIKDILREIEERKKQGQGYQSLKRELTKLWGEEKNYYASIKTRETLIAKLTATTTNNTKSNNKNASSIKNKTKETKKYKEATEELLKLKQEEQEAEKRAQEQRDRESELAEAFNEANDIILKSAMTLQEQEEYEVKKSYKRKLDLAEQFGEDTTQLEIALQNELNDIRVKYAQEELEEQKRLEAERLKKQYETFKEWTQLTTDFFIQQSERRIEQLDKEIERREQNYSRLEELARNGNITAQQSLAEEQRLIVEANRQKIAEQKRIERIKLAQTTLDIYSSKVDAGDKTPLLSTIKDVALIRQFIASLPAFEEGTENTGPNGKGVDGKGGFLSVLHPYERVVDADNNYDIGTLSNNELSSVAKRYNAGQLVDISRVDKVGNSYDLIPLLKKIDSLENTIKNRPTHNIELGEITQSLMQIVQTTKQGNKTTTNRFNIRK